MLRSFIRYLGIVAKRLGPPGTARYRALQRLSWLLPRRLRGNYEASPVAECLHRFALERDAVFFVQVGAHEGRAGDPIALYIKRDDWRGVLVEPVPSLYQRLRRHYRHVDGLAFENVAIAEADGRRPFFRLAATAGEVYELADSLGSLDRDVLLSHEEQVPGIDDYIEEIEIPCWSFETLLRRHEVETIDLLHLDTEGYDGRLLSTFPWERFRPQVVVYEHDHLDDDERRATERMLRRHGYELCSSRTNTLAQRAAGSA